MKKANKIGLLLTFICVAAFINPSKAQDATKELAEFTKTFQETYNKQDDKALKEMYTKDAVNTQNGGADLNGNEAIAMNFAGNFQNSKLSIVITQTKVETQTDGSTIATGTYHVTGKTNAGEAVNISGAYTNTVIKENGHWRIAKSVLAAM